MMKHWAILLYGIGISGGANVIFNHALNATFKGVEITIITLEKKGYEDAKWHNGTEKFRYMTLEEAKKECFDVAIATEWRSAYDIGMINANKYVYFVQSIESKFYRDNSCILAYLANQTYKLPFMFVTEATWIKDYLYDNYGVDAALVLNGIDKNIFNTNITCVEERNPKKIRFLVEGSTKNWLKNVKNTIRICKDAGAEEIWLVTPDDITTFDGVDRVFSNVKMSEMSQIYNSCDVLVKLSLVEGMFGPPLEMFHCGGTAVTYEINGAEEYIINGYNALTVEINNEEEVKNAVRKLINDRELLLSLKKNALESAGRWCDWNESSSMFYDALLHFKPTSPKNRGILKYNALEGADAYRRVEKYVGTCPGNNRLQEFEKKYKEGHFEAYIYGAGNLCKNTLVLLSEYDICISGIVVSDKNNNPVSVMGHKVHCIDEIVANRDEVLIYISSEDNYQVIENKLKEMGIFNII